MYNLQTILRKKEKLKGQDLSSLQEKDDAHYLKVLKILSSKLVHQINKAKGSKRTVVCTSLSSPFIRGILRYTRKIKGKGNIE